MDGTRVLGAAAVALALTGCGRDDSGSNGVGHAYRACERAVESQLRAPATADFSGVFGSTITELEDDTVEVIGYVDSENGFGANIRTDFSCTVRHVGEDWELVDLQV